MGLSGKTLGGHKGLIPQTRAALGWMAFVFWALSGAGVWWTGTPAEGRVIGEFELKAAFLPKLPLFVRWPAPVFQDPKSPFFIGVLGENPFGDHLVRAAAGKALDGHVYTVRMCRDLEEAGRCHIVFIRAGAADGAALERLAEKNVLTVGDAQGFAGAGGMIGLVAENKKVRLEVNLEAIQRAKLRVDPQFLKMATVINPPGRGVKP